MSQRFRSAFAAPTGFVAAVTRAKPVAGSAGRSVDVARASLREPAREAALPAAPRLAA